MELTQTLWHTGLKTRTALLRSMIQFYLQLYGMSWARETIACGQNHLLIVYENIQIKYAVEKTYSWRERDSEFAKGFIGHTGF